MAGILRLNNTSNTGQTTLTSIASTDRTINLPDADGTLLISTSTTQTPLPDGTEAAPGITFANDLDTGIYRPATNEIGLVTGANERLRIDNSGNVGIGTENPGSILHTAANNAEIRIQDLSVSSANTSDARVGFYHSGGTKTAEIGFTATGDNTSLKFRSTVSTGLALGTDNIDVLYIDTSQRVGIGTTGPDENLHIVGADAEIKIENTAAESGSRLTFENDLGQKTCQVFLNGSTRSTFGGAGAFNIYQGASAPILFSTSDTERARIDSSGRLLVGTSDTSESARAILQGNSFSSTGGCILKLSRGNATPNDGGDLGNLQFTDSNHGFAANISAKRDGGTWTSGSSQPTRLEFSTTADGDSSPTEAVVIDSTSNVKINARIFSAFTNGDTGDTRTLTLPRADQEGACYLCTIQRSSSLDTTVSATIIAYYDGRGVFEALDTVVGVYPVAGLTITFDDDGVVTIVNTSVQRFRFTAIRIG